jgi:septal ring-binding cell division protein DamX
MKLYTLLTLAFFVSGCSSSGTQSVDDRGSNNTGIKPWFCQSSADSEDWDCVRSESLVRNPKTAEIRRQKKRAGNQKEESIAFEPESKNLKASSADIINKKIEPQQRPDSIPSADSPAYIKLAYRSSEPVSLLNLPKNFWAVQLIALSQKKALEKYANESDLKGLSGAQIAVNDKLFYVLLLGIYETKKHAKEAIKSIQDKNMKNPPWVRSLGSLQKSMIAGDKLAQEPTD